MFLFCRKKAQPKRFFKIQPKFPQFVFLMEELSRKSATEHWWDGGIRGGRAPQKQPPSSPHVITTILCRCVQGTSAPSTHCYIKMSCASPPVAKGIHRTQSLGKVCPKDNSMTPSGQNLGHSTLARVHVFFGTPWATATHCSQAGVQRMPTEDMSHHKPQHIFASSANSSNEFMIANSF